MNEELTPEAQNDLYASEPELIRDNTAGLVKQREAYQAENGPLATMMRQDEAEEQRIATEQNNMESEQAYRNGPLLQAGPSQDTYDYPAAYKKGGSLAWGKDDGVTLPNEAIKPYKSDVAGFDIATGQNITGRYKDNNGWIKKAMPKIAASNVNTSTGAPVDDSIPLAEIAYGLLDEDVDFDEFNEAVPNTWSEDQKRIAWKAAQSTKFRQSTFPQMVEQAQGEEYPATPSDVTYKEQDLPKEKNGSMLFVPSIIMRSPRSSKVLTKS